MNAPILIAYGRSDRAIAEADANTVLQRWAYGRRLLCDPRATDPSGSLRPGVMADLIHAARKRGVAISGAEIEARLAAGRAYPCRSQIRRARALHGSWAGLCDAGFPPADADPGDQPHDPRSGAEIARAVDRQLELGQDDPDQLSLFEWFPEDRYGPLSSLADLLKYAEDCRARTDRHRQRDVGRFEYISERLDAVGGDASATWEAAQAALDALARPLGI